MTVEVSLPRLVGTREAADAYVDALPWPLPTRVDVLCGQLRAGTSSFADQLIVRLIVDGPVTELNFIDGPEEFLAHVTESARKRHVESNVRQMASAS